MNNLDTNPFHNIIQLEEITHFQKPHNQPPKSILATHKYKSSSPLDYDYQNQNGSSNKSGKKVSYYLNKDDEPTPSTSSEKISRHLSEPGQFSNNFDNEYDKSLRYGPTTSNSQPHSSGSNGRIGFRASEEDDSESDTEFRRDFTQLPTRGRCDPDELSIKSSGSQDSHGSRRNNGSGFFDSGISDENLFPLPNDIEVTRSDVIFAIIVFLIHLGELVTDCTLTVWHYRDGQKWACLFTVTLIATGAVSMLHQFGFIQPDQLDRTFRKGKRMRLLVNCFPFAASSFVSLEGAISAKKAFSDGMQSQQYFRILEVSRCVMRVQSFFQAAPQAALQLIILMENLHDTSSDKVWFTFANIVISLVVMTNANLPSKTDSQLNEAPSKAAYLPFTRIFVGLRMFSSLGSRCMAITFLMVGCRCIVDHLDLNHLLPSLLNDNSTRENYSQYHSEDFSSSSTSSAGWSTFTGICLLIFPRIIFTITDYCAMKRSTLRNIEHYRDQPELGVSTSHPIDRVPLCRIFVGYLATVFFPVGDPFWLFWYSWCEAAIFIIFGNVASFTHSCLHRWTSGVYTTIFVVTFILIPCIIPAAKAAVHRRKIAKVRRILQVQVVDDGDPPPQNSMPSGGNATNNNEIWGK